MSSSENEEDYSPSAQLAADLQSSITVALNTRRPLLTHLNADTTWLLSIPYPLAQPNSRSRRYYHILIDPWLKGGQADVAKFFSQQWHEVESCVQSISEVEDVIQGIEKAAKGGHDDEDWDMEEDNGNWIDAVVISHEFTDHMHRETLLEVPPSVPVFATSKAASIMRSWAHFNTVLDIPRFTGDWRTSSVSPLPDWVGVSRVAYDGPDLLYYHSAIMITFRTSGTKETTSEEEAEAVIYTPHGISPENLSSLVSATPPIQTLALLHGLQDIQIKTSWTTGVKAQLNKGAHNGLKVQRMLKARYWIGTHDEVKRGGGVISWFLDRTAISLQDAMELEKKDLEDREGVLVELGDVRFEDLKNGESLILE